jgi:hypothetical protein|tara:strand:- start:730 stop:987 length:258 start_codon:yes stop_codon:yes gene_type:complete
MKKLSVSESFSFRTNPRSKYDWDTLLDGNNWLMVQGTDFDCSAKSFRNRCYVYAQEKGLKCHTFVRKIQGVDHMLIRAFNPADGD